METQRRSRARVVGRGTFIASWWLMTLASPALADQARRGCHAVINYSEVVTDATFVVGLSQKHDRQECFFFVFPGPNAAADSPVKEVASSV